MLGPAELDPTLRTVVDEESDNARSFPARVAFSSTPLPSPRTAAFAAAGAAASQLTLAPRLAPLRTPPQLAAPPGHHRRHHRLRWRQNQLAASVPALTAVFAFQATATQFNVPLLRVVCLALRRPPSHRRSLRAAAAARCAPPPRVACHRCAPPESGVAAHALPQRLDNEPAPPPTRCCRALRAAIEAALLPSRTVAHFASLSSAARERRRSLRLLLCAATEAAPQPTRRCRAFCVADERRQRAAPQSPPAVARRHRGGATAHAPLPRVARRCRAFGVAAVRRQRAAPQPTPAVGRCHRGGATAHAPLPRGTRC